MAKRVKNYSWDDYTFQYPWDFWLNGETWEVTMEDASPRCSSIKNLYIAIYQAAQRRGLKVRRKMTNEKLIFQAYDPDAE